MKKVKKIGKLLTKDEQKAIKGGNIICGHCWVSGSHAYCYTPGYPAPCYCSWTGAPCY